MQSSSRIELSEYTKALIELWKSIEPKKPVDEFNVIEVSSTASFFGLFYERIRNAIEYREQNLIRRAAIERILKRRLSLNPSGKDEGENLVRELLWARYFPHGSLSYSDVKNVQKLIDRYLYLYRRVVEGRLQEDKVFISQFVMSLLTCEIEEILSPVESEKQEYFVYFVYQVLKNRIELEDLEDKEKKDLYIFVAIDKVYGQNDVNYLRYHLFKLLYGRILELKKDELEKLISNFFEYAKDIEATIKNPYLNKISKFVKKEKPAFLILWEILEQDLEKAEKVLTDKKELWKEVDRICRKKYELTQQRLNAAAFRSLIYIFVTKMLFALIMEYPLSKWIYGEVDNFSIVVNSLFPPFLMFVIVLFTSIPGAENTKRIYERIIQIIDKDSSYEKSVAFITKKEKPKKPLLVLGFTLFYLFTFMVVLGVILWFLDILGFNLISKSIFLFFVSVVTFFAYRVRQIAKEYTLSYKSPFYQPIVDFFFMPILSMGKFFSQEIGRLNFFILIFDVLIEAPFKLIVEIIEEWIRFVKSKKEEISSEV